MAVHGDSALDCDVLIAGGGPAGSLTAALLRQQAPALRVVVVEAARFPRHHVGEACLPGWAPILRRAGVLESAHEQVAVDKLGFIFNWGPVEAEARWTADFRGEDGGLAKGSWHVDRAWMDAHFLDHARRLGATLLQPARVVGVTPLTGPTPPPKGAPSPGFRVRVQDGETERVLTAGAVVDASGQARLLSRLWSLPCRHHADMHNFAVYGYWQGGLVEDNRDGLRGRERWAVVSSCELGWVWHIPIGEDLVSVGLVTDRDTLKSIQRDELLPTYLEAVRGARQVDRLVAEATYLGDRPVPRDGGEQRVNVIRDWSYKAEQLCGAGWYLVGDGALFVDPILSSGLTLASTGASMVANAITTRALEDDVDNALLDESFEATYRDISAAYHRMARVWYRRNSRTDSWHWQARQERLRTAGADALFEEDAESFTAVCLGAINSPLDAVLPRYSRETWGSEYFTWLTSDRLFGRAGDGDEGRAQTRGIEEAKDRSRWSLMTRWRKISAGTARLLRPWRVAEGYHTNRMVSRWSPMRYVEVQLEDPLDPDLRVACPAFAEAPAGVFPALDGETPLRAAVARLVARWPVGSPERFSRLKAATETVLQLHMLGLLDVQAPSLAAPALSDHALLRSVARAALAAAPEARVVLEVGWLGQSIGLTLDWGPHRLRMRLSPLAATAPERVLGASHETAVDWARGVEDGHDAVVVGFLKRLRAQERKRQTWVDMAALAGVCVGLRRDESGVRAELLAGGA
jgi:clorobiocin biosynthesis protein Clo-hal